MKPTEEEVSRRVAFSRMRVASEPHESTGVFPDRVIVALAEDRDRLRALLAPMAEIGERIRTQDNRITADPIFVVQQQRRYYGQDFEEGYAWMDEDWNEADAARTKRFENAYLKHGTKQKGWARIGYQDHWETVQPFFTEAGAKAYLKVNGHNLQPETRVYVVSAFRNAEWQAVRNFLKGLAAPSEGGSR